MNFLTQVLLFTKKRNCQVDLFPWLKVKTYFPRIRKDLNAKVLPKDICKYDQEAFPRHTISDSEPILFRLKSPSLAYSGGFASFKYIIFIRYMNIFIIDDNLPQAPHSYKHQLCLPKQNFCSPKIHRQPYCQLSILLFQMPDSESP